MTPCKPRFQTALCYQLDTFLSEVFQFISSSTLLNQSCKCQILRTVFSRDVSQKFQLSLSFLILTPTITFFSIFHKTSSLFTCSLRGILISNLPQVFSSAVWKLFNIQCHVGGLILHSRSAFSYGFVTKFWYVLILCLICRRQLSLFQSTTGFLSHFPSSVTALHR